ncbi:uracil-DNA glycosylase family protein [uncultured Megasphaera sp.]|uniref:uracil-DNA glycosylase family protein n=1 Tax=uncultured Megasphaera sp. TaxID=165188 RepID=UPI002591625E|nr:uracil-DNA glycosylase family protein [uncultured Megasphaera sp.]
MHLQEIIDQLKTDERNAAYTARGIGPIFQIHEEAKILIIGQAPGKKVEESGIPFHDKSGEKLMTWMGIDSQIFYSPAISIMPMDFYYPGKAKTGDKPPRRFIAQEYHREILQLMPDLKLTILVGKRHRLLSKRPERAQFDGNRAELSSLSAGLFSHRPSQSAQLPLAGQESLVRGRRRAGITKTCP